MDYDDYISLLWFWYSFIISFYLEIVKSYQVKLIEISLSWSALYSIMLLLFHFSDHFFLPDTALVPRLFPLGMLAGCLVFGLVVPISENLNSQ